MVSYLHRPDTDELDASRDTAGGQTDHGVAALLDSLGHETEG